MKEYAVQNIGSRELLSDWTTDRQQAERWADESESDESQPETRIVEREQETQPEPPFMRTYVSVDDRRFPPGHPDRAGGLFVAADVFLRDAAPCADAPTRVETRGGGEPNRTDVAFALSQIEQQAWDALHAMDEET